MVSDFIQRSITTNKSRAHEVASISELSITGHWPLFLRSVSASCQLMICVRWCQTVRWAEQDLGVQAHTKDSSLSAGRMSALVLPAKPSVTSLLFEVSSILVLLVQCLKRKGYAYMLIIIIIIFNSYMLRCVQNGFVYSR